MINRVDDLVLTVADLNATLEFYERALGFKRKLKTGQPLALLLGEQNMTSRWPQAQVTKPGCFAKDSSITAGRASGLIRSTTTRISILTPMRFAASPKAK